MLRRAAASFLLALAAAAAAAPRPGLAQNVAFTVQAEVARTQDGETLAIKRLAVPGGTPVLFLPGFGSNMWEFDLPSASLARYLASRGYDVWLANWRRTGKAPFRSTGRAGYTIDDLIQYDLPALVDAVRAATGERPFLVGHSMGAMVPYGYLQGARYERAVVSKRLSFGAGGFSIDDVYAQRMGGDPQLAQARNAAIRGFVGIAGPARMKWKRRVTPYDFWMYSFWDYNLLLTELSWTPAAIAAAYSVDEVPSGRLTDFLTDDLAKFPFVGPEIRPYLAAVAAQVGPSYLSAEAMYGPNMDGQVAFDALDWACDDASTGCFRQFMDGIRNETFREAHFLDPARRPYVYADHYDRITAPVLLFGGTYDKLCCDDVLEADGFRRMGSADKTYVQVRAGHVDIVDGKNAPAEVWAKIAAWMAAHP
jgi:pimeloyl-ACP methyl ester carboxylesterase